MTPAKKAAARPNPTPAGLVGTVVGNHTVDGVPPGGKILARTVTHARALHLAGHARFTVDGETLTDGDFVALIEAGF